MASSIRDPEFCSKLTDWIAAAIRQTAKAVKRGEVVLPAVVRQAMVGSIATGRMEVHAVRTVGWMQLIDAESDRFKKMPQYSILCDYVLTNGLIRQFLLQNSPGQDLTNPEILDIVLFGTIGYPILAKALRLSIGNGKGHVRRSRLRSMYLSLEEQIFGAPSRWRVIVPLFRVVYGLGADSREFTIDLTQTLRIRPATDTDRQNWLSAEDVHAVGGGYFPMFTQCLVEFWESAEVGQQPDLTAVAEQVVIGLRLYGGGGFTVPCLVVTRADRWMDEQWALRPFASSRSDLGGLGMVLTLGDRAALRRFWNRFADSTRSLPIPLEIALRRFERATSDAPVQDRLIDCCVAFDALLSADDRQEMTYKVCMRGAYLLGNDPTERQDVYELLSGAYAARGAIIHGSKQPADALARWVQKSQPSASANTFVNNVANLLGRLLRTMLLLRSIALPDGERYDFRASHAGPALDRNILTAGENLRAARPGISGR